MFKQALRSTLVLGLGVCALNSAGYASDGKVGELPPIDKRYQVLETLARGMYYLETMYVDETKVKPEDLAINALRGVTDRLDPHTVLMPKKAFEQLTIDTQGKFGGVGVIVSQENNKLTVVSPIEDTPAYVAGVKAGDEIIAINGQDIRAMKSSDAVELMRGEPGSVLKLSVIREGVKDPISFSLTREIIKVKSVKGETLSQSIKYARISSFQEETADELEAFLAKQKDMKGLVLDLRDNPGGLLDQAVKVSDIFIESGLIVSTVGRDRAKVEREFATKRGTRAGFPVVVLINGGSASASEIVAGALQDHERALIMGTTSFGKGSVQTLVSLPDGSGLKLTVARYFTPKDRSIQAKGITPDIMVPYQDKGKKAADAGKSDGRKESDLEGHINSEDLSDLAKETDIKHYTKSWPKDLGDDNQVVTAFTYLKTLSKQSSKK